MPDVNLQKHVLEAFEFLISDRGYRCTDQAGFRVRFESPVVFVEATYDRSRSYELRLLIGLLGVEPRQAAAFSIDEILRLRRAPNAKDFVLMKANSEEKVIGYIERLAQALRDYGTEFLLGDRDSFVELARQRRSDIEVYSLERELRRARTNAQSAWDAGDYAGVVRAFGHLRHALTPAEAEKLNLAEERLQRVVPI